MPPPELWTADIVSRWPLIDTNNGRVIGHGLEAIPERDAAEKLIADLEFFPLLAEEKRQRELRILNAFDLERCCL